MLGHIQHDMPLSQALLLKRECSLRLSFALLLFQSSRIPYCNIAHRVSLYWSIAHRVSLSQTNTTHIRHVCYSIAYVIIYYDMILLYYVLLFVVLLLLEWLIAFMLLLLGHIRLRATQVRAHDDRAYCLIVRISYVSTLCPVVTLFTIILHMPILVHFWTAYASELMFQLTCVRTNVSELMFQNWCFRTDVSAYVQPILVSLMFQHCALLRHDSSLLVHFWTARHAVVLVLLIITLVIVIIVILVIIVIILLLLIE